MSETEQGQQFTTFGDGRDINEDNEEIPEWARPYIRTLKLQVNDLQAQLAAAKHELSLADDLVREAGRMRAAANERAETNWQCYGRALAQQTVLEAELTLLRPRAALAAEAREGSSVSVTGPGRIAWLARYDALPDGAVQADLSEELRVVALCREFGFGRVMQIASEAWREQDPIGALTIGPAAGSQPSLTEPRTEPVGGAGGV